MTSGPSSIVPPEALSGVSVGLSVSNSADLARLGLAPRHCDLAVAELARAILIAGGSIVYGGRLVPTGFTQILLDEVRGFAEDRDALTICLAPSEHLKMSNDELLAFIGELHTSAVIVCLDQEGRRVDPTERDLGNPVDIAVGLTALRRHITEISNARVLVGGQLSGYQGSMPGVIEESLMTAQARQPLYAAGGFGGAAAAVANALGYDDLAWAPPDYPAQVDEVRGVLDELAELAVSGLSPDGLEGAERSQLAATHRPGDIAALVVSGLSRLG
jgi:hypothetical protein